MVFAAAHGDRLAARRHRRDAARQPRPGDPRDADRRRSRRCARAARSSKRPSAARSSSALVVIGALGGRLLVYGLLGDGVAPPCACSAIGLGALGLFVGIAAARAAARPPARRASSACPAPRFGGAAGRLAQENAIRNPGRTASTAAALMIGLALVTFVAVFGAGCSTSRRERDRASSSTPTTCHLAERLGRVRRRRPARRCARRRRRQPSRDPRRPRAAAGGGEVDVNGVDPATIGARLPASSGTQGSDAVARRPRRRRRDRREVVRRGPRLAVGDPFALRTPAGSSVRLVVRGIYEHARSSTRCSAASSISQAGVRPLRSRGPATCSRFVERRTRRDAALEAALAAFPDARSRPRTSSSTSWTAGSTTCSTCSTCCSRSR